MQIARPLLLSGRRGRSSLSTTSREEICVADPPAAVAGTAGGVAKDAAGTVAAGGRSGFVEDQQVDLCLPQTEPSVPSRPVASRRVVAGEGEDSPGDDG